MIVKELYTGNGVSLSPKFEDGRTLSDYVRLVADEEKAITNGERIAICVDVLITDVDLWSDCELPMEDLEEVTEQDYQNALAEMGVDLNG